MRILVVVVVWCAAPAAAQTPPLQFVEQHGGHFPRDTRNSTDLAAADVDGDGDSDLVLASETGCALHRNDGHAVFGAGSPLPGGSAMTVAFADVDNDGDQDLILGRASGITGVRNGLLRNDGTGAFTDVTSTQMPLTADVTLSIAIGDVDRDGDLDLVFGNDSANRLNLNDGTGRFTEALAGRLPPGSASTGSLALGDVDGDGDLDLVVGNLRTTNQLFLNDGTGRFSDATAGRLPTVAGWTRALLFVDVDGDRDLDLLVGDEGEIVRLLRNDGTGRFADLTATTMPQTQLGTHDLAAADVDHDGDLDVAVASSYGGNRLFLNDGSGRFVEAGPARLRLDALWATCTAFVDLDGDARADLVFGGADCSVGQSTLHLNDGNGWFTPAASTPLSGPCGETYSLAPLTDLDADGDLDLVVGNEGLNTVFFNDGEGQFVADPTALPPDRDTTYAIASGDVDGDGDPDLLLGSAGGQARLYLNDARGRFTDATARLPVRTDSTFAVLLVDVDRDGDLDAVLGIRGDQSRLYLNDGAGNFTDATATRLPVVTAATAALAAVDVDADNDLDLVLANHMEPCRLWLNDGSGRFTDRTATHMPGLSAPTEGLVAADLDGDGDIDLVVVNYGPAQLFANDGSGHFTDATAGRLPPTTTSEYDGIAGDLDDDGDVDLVLGRRMLVNDGTGRFTDVTAQRLPSMETPSALRAGDVDGDADLDLVFGRSPTTLLQNRLRHQHTPLVARRGAPFALDFAVEPGFAPAPRTVIPWLAVARLAPPVVVPPFGAFGLHPGLMVQLPPLTVPVASGAVRVDLTIPVVPIQGLALHAQALCSHGAAPGAWRLTGVSSDTVIH